MNEDRTKENDVPSRPSLGRGRGFIPAFMRKSERQIGSTAQQKPKKKEDEIEHWDPKEENNEIPNIDWRLVHENDYKDVDLRRNRNSGRDNWNENEDDRGFGDYHERRGRFEGESKCRGFRDSNPEPSKPKPSLYIPKRPTEDEDEIFGSGISSGINFDRFDSIEVNMSGAYPYPEPIHVFEKAGLKEVLLELIKKCNYTKVTPIQKYAIPAIMSGRDMMGCAQTGSGKTAAFLIPIINKLLDNPEPRTKIDSICKPQVLILAPTRELAIQIFNEARKFSRGSGLKTELAYGGTHLSYQIQLLGKGCDILVATPGRLLDIIRRKRLSFELLKFAVMDEADRLLLLGFLQDVEEVMRHILEESSDDRQILMFSATFPEEVQDLAGKFLKNYLFIAVGIVGGASLDVEQRFYLVSKFEKRNKLIDLLEELEYSKCLIFVERKRTTDVLAAYLSERNFRATSIHGGREQQEREEAMEDFKNGRMKILVATSVAARGLDIKDVDSVINYDLPKTIEEYVHRIGRTGRVGNRGLAISFYDEAEDRGLTLDLIRVLKECGQEIPDFFPKFKNCRTDHISTSIFGGQDVRENNTSPYDDEDSYSYFGYN